MTAALTVPRRPVRRTAAALASCALLLGSAGCSKSVSGDGIPSVDGPHRVPVAGSPGGYHWVALGRDWSKLAEVDTDDIGTTRDTIGTDGERVFVVTVKLPSATAEQYPPGKLTAYDGADGRTLWSSRFQWAPDTVPVGADGVVVLASGTTSPRSDPSGITYVAFDGATGEERWRRSLAATRMSTVVDQFLFAPGVFLRGLFYYADGDTVYALDARTGAVRHRRRLPDFDIVGGPVVSGDRLAVVADPTVDNETTDREQLVVFDAALAPSSVYSYPDTTDRPNCARRLLAGSDGLLLGWNDNTMLCVFEQRAGRVRLLWSAPIDSQNPVAPVGGVVPLFDFSDSEVTGGVIGLDARTGRRLWTSKAPEALARERIAVVDGTLFAVGHHVQILDPKTGRTAFDAQPRFHGDNVGGDDQPVFAAGHVVVLRADGIWAFH